MLVHCSNSAVPARLPFLHPCMSGPCLRKQLYRVRLEIPTKICLGSSETNKTDACPAAGSSGLTSRRSLCLCSSCVLCLLFGVSLSFRLLRILLSLCLQVLSNLLSLSLCRRLSNPLSLCLLLSIPLSFRLLFSILLSSCFLLSISVSLSLHGRLLASSLFSFVYSVLLPTLACCASSMVLFACFVLLFCFSLASFLLLCVLPSLLHLCFLLSLTCFSLAFCLSNSLLVVCFLLLYLFV